jgi:uroporphyrin-III C-methyltransferase
MILNKIENGEKEPKITLVGAGPGDPELISLKAVKAINSADVVLYDAQVNEALLNHAPEGAIKIYVGKKSDDESFSQDAVNKLMIDYALNYGHVVRLKSGDHLFLQKDLKRLISLNPIVFKRTSYLVFQALWGFLVCTRYQ